MVRQSSYLQILCTTASIIGAVVANVPLLFLSHHFHPTAPKRSRSSSPFIITESSSSTNHRRSAATTREEEEEEQQQQPPGMSRDAALAIVPPDQVWDQLQRARYYARDKSYGKWPPCLRLLHPFGCTCTSRRYEQGDGDETTAAADLALCVARVIEKHQIQPFHITLTEWSVIPHAEAMESDLKAIESSQCASSSYASSAADETLREISDEDKAIQKLILDEERKGREKLRERNRRRGIEVVEDDNNDGVEKQNISSESPRALWEKQKQMYEEFNGPCVVCLEPDEASRRRIVYLRELLLEEPELAKFASYAPTLTLSDMFPFSTSTHSMEYRPLVPIGSFPTVTSAVEMARKLRTLWDPLSIRVTDLHIVSSGKASSLHHPTADNEASFSAGGSSPSYSTLTQHVQTKCEKQIACDALIMLAGEELAMDNQYNEEMANVIARDGYSGGYGRSSSGGGGSSSSVRNDQDSKDQDDLDAETGIIQQWLDDWEDDEEDEGTVVVIGRTHFFTGEMRSYMGMPATSVAYATDRAASSRTAGRSPRRRSSSSKRTNNGSSSINI